MIDKPTLHVVSLPHTCTIEDYSWCAYTQKVRKFCDMMTDQGYQINLYAGPCNEAKCDIWIDCTLNYEIPKNGFIPEFDPNNFYFKNFNWLAIEGI